LRRGDDSRRITGKENRMRAEPQALVDDIEQAIALLRRHL
jgi:hypothetical protein